MNKSDFITAIEDLFETDEGSVSGQDVLEQIDGWCSLIFVGLIAMIDEQYGLAIDPQALLNGQTVDGLFALLVKTKQQQGEVAA